MNEDSPIIPTLLVDDDSTFRKALAGALRRRKLLVDTADSPIQALALASRKHYSVAILDLKMPGLDGIQLMQALQEQQPALEVVLLTGHGTIPSAIAAMKAGASHYLLKPCEVEEVELAVRHAAREGLLSQENEQLKEAIRRSRPYEGIVGASPAIEETIQQIKLVKDAWSPVLILGESGTGKELVAQALHASSIRADKPMVTINCAGLKPDLLENELFGHVEGAFTGASRAKRGLFEVADQGTLFIDEIADMDLTIQAALLRVVENGTFRPLGSTRERKVRVRILSAANRNLDEEARAGRFRSDLLFRLDVVRIHIPPLRERPQDIPLLADHYLKQSREAREKRIFLSDEALELLKAYPFPGNVRELFGVLERAVLLSSGRELSASALNGLLRPGQAPPHPAPERTITLMESEKRHIRLMLEREAGNISRVSALLGIDRRTLQRKMKRYGLR